jgi:ABC-type cobalamin/Fe3+-siderophores transport system ATPase subunit
MKDNQAKYIECVQIEGFWERYDVDWQLNPDVNILVGENGTGKSSLLTLLKYALGGDKGYSEKYIFAKKIKIYENDHKEIFDGDAILSSFALPEKKIEKKAFSVRGKKSCTLNIDYLSTFDTNLLSQSDYQANSWEVRTELDFLLKILLNEFVTYELRQTRKAARNEITFAQALEKKNYLVATINRLFKNTNKRIDDEQGDFAFRLNKNKKLSVYDLSSGEKQLLLILFMVMRQEEKPSVLLLDEPEITLHILWQHELIEIIRTLNPNCQIIMATHSLSLFTKKWRDKVFFMIGGQNGEKGILQPAKMPELI